MTQAMNAQLIQSKIFILKRRQVEARAQISRSTLYQKVKDGLFPKPIKLGVRAVGWVEVEVEQWLANQVATSRGIVNA